VGEYFAVDGPDWHTVPECDCWFAGSVKKSVAVVECGAVVFQFAVEVLLWWCRASAVGCFAGGFLVSVHTVFVWWSSAWWVSILPWMYQMGIPFRSVTAGPLVL
jgi:hypothetical protein